MEKVLACESASLHTPGSCFSMVLFSLLNDTINIFCMVNESLELYTRIAMRCVVGPGEPPKISLSCFVQCVCVLVPAGSMLVERWILGCLRVRLLLECCICLTTCVSFDCSLDGTSRLAYLETDKTSVLYDQREKEREREKDFMSVQALEGLLDRKFGRSLWPKLAFLSRRVSFKLYSLGYTCRVSSVI